MFEGRYFQANILIGIGVCVGENVGEELGPTDGENVGEIDGLCDGDCIKNQIFFRIKHFEFFLLVLALFTSVGASEQKLHVTGHKCG